MKKRSTGADGAKLRQVVVEQPKMVKKQVEILGKEEEQRSNKSSILEASKDDGARRRGSRSMTGSDMMEEIDYILREEGGSSVGLPEEEVAVEAKIEFGRKEWWGCCCKDLNRLVI